MVKDNLLAVKQTLKENVKLVAVSKYQPMELLEEAYEAGQRVFGESHALEVRDKAEVMPKDIEWHFIGHLQTNKVKYIAPFISCIESVDSLKLMQEINKQALKNDRMIDCLLQFHVAQEETKSGFTLEECEQVLSSEEFSNLKNIRIIGVMGMATYTEDEKQIRKEFKTLVANFAYLKMAYFSTNQDFKEISMGMTDDYKIAMSEGSTIVRVGSGIFGERS
ncbi:MAG: YggS family pyridoxal phosphate-dependent enzyme [Paludibacteraceae bacterium]|nr:YggS family pyridoxal phosphate-dependent enzyme [Paludibacteraceae bacterium]